MNLDNLRAGLTELADDVEYTDLRDRAVRTSRRITRTRIALVAAATVVVVAVASAAATLGRDDRALPEIATTPSPVATLPAGATSAVYIDDLTDSSVVTEWSPGGTRRLRLAGSASGGPAETAIRQTMTVSPNGAYLSWMDAFGLRVVPLAEAGGLLDSTSGFVLESLNKEEPMVYGGCVWSPDSTRLLAGVRNPAELGWIDGWYTLTDRSFAPADTGDLGFGCGAAVNGDWVAALVQPRLDQISTVVWNTRTGERRQLLDGVIGIELTGIAPDGSRLAARIIDGYSDPYRVPERNRQGTVLIDTRTGATLPLDTGGREVRQLYFESDGDLLARVRDGDHNSLLTFAPDGRLTGDDREPPELLDAVLLRLVRP